MSSVQQYSELLRYTEWADATLWGAVLRHPDSAADDTIRNYLAHIHSVQRAFLDAWTDRPFAFRSGADFPDLVSLYAFARPYYGEARAFLATAPDLARPMRLPWTGFIEQHFGRTLAQTTLEETIVQVINHSTYHRGQLNARLRATGGEPPMVDYIAWVWFSKPEPEWSAQL